MATETQVVPDMPAKMSGCGLKGAYVVTEPGCLMPTSGAHNHIMTGISELGRHFEIQPLLPVASAPSSGKVPACSQSYDASSTSPCAGVLRDLKRLAVQARSAWKLTRRLSGANYDFVYVRSNFLDPLPFFLRLRGVPCVIESNGLQYEGIKKHYRSHLSPLNRLLERLTYSVATHVFFVGSYGDYWKLPGDRWINVENGVEGDFLNSFATARRPPVSTLRLCFVGSLMQHHRPDVLIEAVKRLSQSHQVELHLVGARQDSIANSLANALPVIMHGFLEREPLAAVLREMHVGLIAGAPEYASLMKLLDYGAARMAVVAPNTHHLTSWFPDDLVFFNSGDPASMADAILSLAEDRERVAKLGNQLHDRIRQEFTWEKIFAKKAEIIQQRIQEMR